jgi:hypothetical protein
LGRPAQARVQGLHRHDRPDLIRDYLVHRRRTGAEPPLRLGVFCKAQGQRHQVGEWFQRCGEQSRGRRIQSLHRGGLHRPHRNGARLDHRVYPDNDIPIIESPIAIIKNTKNPEAAKLLYDYIISEEGQTVLLEEFTLPINPKMVLANSIDVKDAEARMLPVDIEFLVTEKLSMLEKFDKIFK